MEGGPGRGKGKAEDVGEDGDGVELPRHLLGQKPDFEAEGGGRGEGAYKYGIPTAVPVGVRVLQLKAIFSFRTVRGI